jgi:hypothetical protein
MTLKQLIGHWEGDEEGSYLLNLYQWVGFVGALGIYLGAFGGMVFFIYMHSVANQSLSSFCSYFARFTLLLPYFQLFYNIITLLWQLLNFTSLNSSTAIYSTILNYFLVL